MEIYSTDNTEFFMEALFGPAQHDAHMKNWRWHLHMRGTDRCMDGVRAALDELRAARRVVR